MPLVYYRSKHAGAGTQTGCTDPAAVRHLLHAGELKHTVCEVLDIGSLERYERPLPVMHEYDRLLVAGGAQ